MVAVAAVTPVALVVLLFSLLTGLTTESLRLTTKFLLILYWSGDFDSLTCPLFPLV